MLTFSVAQSPYVKESKEIQSRRRKRRRSRFNPEKLARAAMQRLVQEMVLQESGGGSVNRVKKERIRPLSKKLREHFMNDTELRAEHIASVFDDNDKEERPLEDSTNEGRDLYSQLYKGRFEEMYGLKRVKVARSHVKGERHSVPQRIPTEVKRHKVDLFAKVPASLYVNRHRDNACMESAFSYMIENISVPLKSKDVRVSKEMLQKAKETLASCQDSGLWGDVISSQIAKPLDALAFCSPEAQAAQPGHALKYNPSNADELLRQNTSESEDRSQKWKRLKPSGPESQRNQAILHEIRERGKEIHFNASGESKEYVRDIAVDTDMTLFPYSVDAHEAATLICRCWRRYIRRLGLITAKIQALVRGVLTRQYVQGMRYVMTESASHMQGLVRGFLGRLVYLQLKEAVEMGAPIRDLEIYDILTSPCKIRHELARYQLDNAIIERRRKQYVAAAVLQCSARRKQAVRRVQQLRELRARQLKASIGLQSVFRSFVSRRMVEQLKSEFYPGLRKFQSRYRARLARKRFLETALDRERKAVCIQRAFRGMRGRREARKKRYVFDSATRIASLVRAKIAYCRVDKRRHARMQKERKRLSREEKLCDQMMKDREVEVRDLLKQSKTWKQRLQNTAATVRKTRRGKRRALRKLSRGERPLAQAALAFESYDIDGSGSIDTSEFNLVLESLCIRLTPEKTQAALEELDSNCNGTLEQDEFIEWYTKLDKANATKPLTRLKLRAQRTVRYALGFELRRQARNAILKEERAVAKKEAITHFRKYEPSDEWYHTFHAKDWPNYKRSRRKSKESETCD